MAITKGNNQARRQENHLTIDVKMIKIFFENKKEMEINIQRVEEAMKKGKSMKLMQSVTHINKLQMFALKKQKQ